MKTLVLTKSGNPVMVNPETLEVSSITSQRESIRSIYQITESCKVKQEDVETEAEAGDLLVTFWESDFDHNFLVVKCKEWYDMLTNYNNLMQKRKEEWAKNEKANSGDLCCEACEKASID